jgi:hypothetical protein
MSTQMHSRLLRIMRREFDSQGLNLPSSCRNQLERMVSHGVTRMRVSNALDSPSHVIQAEKNLRLMVRYFSDYSKKTGSYPTLKDSDFRNGLLDCPTYWPYWSS